MSKGLESLKDLINVIPEETFHFFGEGIEKAKSNIKKELKALEIIKRMYRPTEHQLKVPLKTEMITQEEYDLLKEVML